MAGEGASDRALRSVGLPGDEQERVAFVSRLLVLATEARRRGAISAERIEQIAGLSSLDDEDRVRLRGTPESGCAEDRDPGRNRLE